MVDQNEIQEHAQGIAKRAQSILTKPTETWDVVAKETDQPMQVFLKYVVPLAAIGPIASFIGGQVFGYSTFFGPTFRPSLMGGLSTAVVTYIFGLLGVWVLAFIANFLSKSFEGKDDFPSAFRLVAYAWTAAWLAGVFGIIPALAVLAIVGLYSLYLFYKGANPIMGVPEDKSVVYTVVVIVAAIIVNIVIGAISVAITGPAMLAGAGSLSASDGDVNIDSPYGSIQIDEANGKATMTIEGNGETMRIEVPTEEE